MQSYTLHVQIHVYITTQTEKTFVTPMGKNAYCHIQHASLWHEANSCKHVAHIFEQIHVNMLLISSQVFHSRWIATADMTLRYLCCVKSNQTTIASKEGHEANQCMGRRHQNTTKPWQKILQDVCYIKISPSPLKIPNIIFFRQGAE